jgi:signal transduction histidine kinase
MHLQTALLRIAQGAIANVVQHAHASTATITISIEGDRLRFTVADNGTGFDPGLASKDTTEKSDSFGLQATSERVKQLGGTLAIDSGMGHGTTLAVDLRLTEFV